MHLAGNTCYRETTPAAWIPRMFRVCPNHHPPKNKDQMWVNPPWKWKFQRKKKLDFFGRKLQKERIIFQASFCQGLLLMDKIRLTTIRMMTIPWFTGFQPSQVVQDFIHQQYVKLWGCKCQHKQCWLLQVRSLELTHRFLLFDLP